MIQDTGIIKVIAKGAAVAYSNGTAQRFKVSPFVFDDEDGTELSVEFDAFNYTNSEIAIGDEFYVGKTIQGYWVPIITAGASAGAMIVFQFDSDEYVESEPNETCAERSSEETVSMRAKVVRRPCGSCRVYGEDDEGYVTVVDDGAGAFLEGRTPADISGKMGFATLMNPEGGCDDYEECEWVITWINWFTERQAVQDWFISDLDIIEEKMNVKVWSYCRLPDEITEGVDCAEDTYYGEDQIIGE